jgi:GxxExxY protein
MEQGTARALSHFELTHQIIKAALTVHSELGPGLLESPYEACLAFELRKIGLDVKTQVGLPVVYQAVKMDLGYRIDLLVADEIVVEIKSIEAVAPVHKTQLLSYLRLSKKKVGLLINFNVTHLKEGIHRVANGPNLRVPKRYPEP